MPSERDFYNVSLKIFLKNNRGEVLILKSTLGGSYEGFYDLPGGRINLNEFEVPFKNIIKREVTEEIGEVSFNLVLKPVGIGRIAIVKKESPLGGPVHVFNVFFEAKYLGGDVKISEEHTDFKWVALTKDNLEQYFKVAVLEGAKMYLENSNNEN